MKFEWDKGKAAANEKKHGISFEEAQSAFDDTNALRIYDPDHSEDEDRRKKEIAMREEYDFSEGVRNPYVKPPKTTVTIRLDRDTVNYFKGLAEQSNIPYQTLINSYLADCAARKAKPSVSWG